LGRDSTSGGESLHGRTRRKEKTETGPSSKGVRTRERKRKEILDGERKGIGLSQRLRKGGETLSSVARGKGEDRAGTSKYHRRRANAGHLMKLSKRQEPKRGEREVKYEET